MYLQVVLVLVMGRPFVRRIWPSRVPLAVEGSTRRSRNHAVPLSESRRTPRPPLPAGLILDDEVLARVAEGVEAAGDPEELRILTQ